MIQNNTFSSWISAFQNSCKNTTMDITDSMKWPFQETSHSVDHKILAFMKNKDSQKATTRSYPELVKSTYPLYA
jgi:hypothetical protein